MDPKDQLIDRCVCGGEYDVAKCMFDIIGVEEDKNRLCVLLSEAVANSIMDRALYWMTIATNPQSGGITRELSYDKSIRLMDIHKKLKTSAYKKCVIAQYESIIASQMHN